MNNSKPCFACGRYGGGHERDCRLSILQRPLARSVSDLPTQEEIDSVTPEELEEFRSAGDNLTKEEKEMLAKIDIVKELNK